MPNAKHAGLETVCLVLFDYYYARGIRKYIPVLGAKSPKPRNRDICLTSINQVVLKKKERKDTLKNKPVICFLYFGIILKEDVSQTNYS